MSDKPKRRMRRRMRALPVRPCRVEYVVKFPGIWNPCPFCGSRSLDYDSNGLREPDFWLRCGSCLATGPIRPTLELAGKAWNQVSHLPLVTRHSSLATLP